MTIKVTIDETELDAYAVAGLMDSELREELEQRCAWRSEQEFVDAYRRAHLTKFGKEFTVNLKLPEQSTPVSVSVR